MDILGISINDKELKGAIVDTRNGQIISKKRHVENSEDLRPHKLISNMHKLVKAFEWDGPVGCAFPAPVRKGIVLSGDRVDPGWTDADIDHLFSEITECRVHTLNETDATGLAEMTFGVGVKQEGVVLVLSVDNVIGSSLFVEGKLVPNTELELALLNGVTIERRASNRARKEEGIQRKKWAKRLQAVLEHYEKLFHPSLFIIGGKLSRKADKTFPYIKIHTRLKAASFENDASIIGAAYFAATREIEATELKS